MNAAALYIQGGIPESVVALFPTRTVAVVLEGHRPRRLERPAAPLCELLKEPGSTVAVEGVFETGAVAILAIAEVALDTHDDFGELRRLVGFDETHRLGQARITVLAGVELPHAATDADVETLQFAVFHNCNQAQILAVDINVVDRRNDVAHLEFARQVQIAVDRLLVFACRSEERRVGKGGRSGRGAA